jgi:hypothetical protein
MGFSVVSSGIPMIVFLRDFSYWLLTAHLASYSYELWTFLMLGTIDFISLPVVHSHVVFLFLPRLLIPCLSIHPSRLILALPCGAVLCQPLLLREGWMPMDGGAEQQQGERGYRLLSYPFDNEDS